MKPVALVLAASLVANAALVTVAVRREPAPSSPASSAAPASRPATPPGKHQASADIPSALKASDAESLRDLLRAAEVPEDTVRSIVNSVIWSRYRERLKAFQVAPDPNAPWWKSDDHRWFNRLTREQRMEQRRLNEEANAEVARVMGPSPAPNVWQDHRLAFLPPEKRKAFQEIEQDYQDLIGEAQQEMQNFALPSDHEKIRFLQEEKNRDLAAILSPSEYADYEMRMSNTANQLRWKMSRFDGTEEEYRKIFAIQKAFDDGQQTDGWGNPIDQSPDGWKRRQEAEKELNARLRESLGEERFTDYTRSQNHEYQQLVSATKRLGLAPDTPAKVFNLRYDIASQAESVAANENLSYDQKKQSLAALAKDTREQIRATLGAEAADVYLKGSAHWLGSLEAGQLVTFSENGHYSGSRTLPRQAPKKPSN